MCQISFLSKRSILSGLVVSEMVLGVLFFNFLCGVFGSNLIAVPQFNYDPRETLVLECDVTQGVKRITLYDHDSGVFKPWHNIDDCAQPLFKGEDLQLTAGKWKKAHSMLFLLCSGEHIICDMLNPASPYKNSIHINYGKITYGSRHKLVCHSSSDLKFEDIYGGLEGSYINTPIYSTGLCSFTVRDAGMGLLFEAFITLGTLNSDAKIFSDKGLDISVTKPTINSVVEQGHRYIFKIAVRSKRSFIHAIDACLKDHPNGECIDYQIDARGKGNFDVISFPVSKNSIENDAYVEIRLWAISFLGNINPIEVSWYLSLKVSHRVNERILEQYRGKMFRKESVYDIMDVHVLECEDGDDSCDNDGTRKFKLTIYGVANPQHIAYFLIQGVKINSGFDCNSELSLCTVTAFMKKHRHTTLEYRIEGTFLALLMADSDSYTAVFKDSSITAVADEDT